MFRLIKKLKDKGRWRIFKLKLIDARLYFVSNHSIFRLDTHVP